MKKCAILLIFILLLSLCSCKRENGIDEDYIEPINTEVSSAKDKDPQNKQQPLPEPQPNEIIENTENTAYDYSQKVEYFKKSYDFWNGENEGATLAIATAAQNDITMSMYIPQGWCYETVDYSPDKHSFGIYFWPEGEENGKIYVSFNTVGWELGCGTGIEFNDIRLGNYDATVATYVSNDINPYMWNHISVLNKTNSVKIWANDAHLWWHKYYDTAIKIMSSLTVTENICSYEQAIEAVCKYKGVDELTVPGCEYDFENNQWIVSELDRINKKMIRYTVSADALSVEHKQNGIS